MNEPAWFTFYTAAREIKHRLGGSEAVAQARLRRACADEKIRSMKAPYDDGNQLPIEFWTRIAPSEWLERQVDYDGPDADGSAIEVMISEADFQSWLGDAVPLSTQRTAYLRASAKQAISELWPDGVPDCLPSTDLYQKVGDWHKAKSLRVPSRTTVFRAAGRRNR
jgi:hypothetical protein